MGVVYEVIDEKTDSPRALKVMLPSLVEDIGLRGRFEREAKITGAIESDHLVRVLDAGIDDATGMPFLAMELLRGEEMATFLKEAHEATILRGGPLPVAGRARKGGAVSSFPLVSMRG